MARGLVRETAHFDRPVTPLFSTLVLPALERGFSRAHDGRARLELRVIDGYVYAGLDLVPAEGVAPAAPEEAPDLGTLADQWARGLVPELWGVLDEMRALLPAHAPPRRMAADFDRIPALLERLYEAHYRVTLATQAGWSMLEDALRDAGEPRSDLAVAVLLSPTESLLRDVDAALAELAGLVAGSPHLRTALAEPAKLPAALAAHPATADAFARVWALVRERPARPDVGAPTWGEDPTPLARALEGGAAARDAFRAGTARALERRAEAEARAVARFPEAARDSVRAVLHMLRQARGAMQSVNFLAGEVAIGLARLACLRAGERLARDGALPRAEDVVLLTREELAQALADGFVEKGLVEARREALARAERAEPPETVGDVDAALVEDPRLAALLGVRARDATGRADELRGLAASPGRATGRARVVRDEADLARVEDGDVLLVLNLAPSWTPAMGRAAAIATETGGMLSHAAIVARELGKPAVVGVPRLLASVADGARLTVDGDAGALTLEPQ